MPDRSPDIRLVIRLCKIVLVPNSSDVIDLHRMFDTKGTDQRLSG